LSRKNVTGIDFSQASLDKAIALKEKLGLDTWHLKKVDIMDEKQIASLGKFDCVLCLGVLHHTGNAYKAFQNILKLAKPNGKIAVGLYNKYGRVLLKVRIFLAKTVFKNNQDVKDWFIKMQIGDVQDKERARGWWNDQYLHPHETSHTQWEVLRWFKRNGVRYVQTVPSMMPFDSSDLECAGVWNEMDSKPPNLLIMAYKQLTWIWKTHKEGGYWIVFGRMR
jgi:2-polyprenyl-3-methyl-5-hydroxy-6-metoxy-1,4-benzoquinol methylase